MKSVLLVSLRSGQNNALSWRINFSATARELDELRGLLGFVALEALEDHSG